MLIGLEWTTTHTHTHKHSYIPPPHVQHSPRHSYTCIIQHYIKHLPAEAIILTSQLILQRFKCRCRCTSRQYFLTTCSCGVGDTHHPFEAELHDSHSSWWRYHRGDKMTTAVVQRFSGLMNAFHFDHSSLICQMWDLLRLPFLRVWADLYTQIKCVTAATACNV